jgi:uncharacterized phage-associated protein
MPYPVAQVANYFIEKGIEADKPITHIKVQKLIYVAHGLFLASEFEPLIEENKIYAWKYGPVIPDLWKLLKEHKAEPIRRKIELKDNTSFSRDAESVMNHTWELCKDLTGVQLSAWTHLPDSPWDKVYHSTDTSSMVIKDDDIGRYYFKLMRDNPSESVLQAGSVNV